MYESNYDINYKKSRIIKIVSLSLTALILIVAAFFVYDFFTNKLDMNYQKLLYDKSKDIVYSVQDDDIIETDKLPRININNNVMNKINEEIVNSYYDYSAMTTNWYTYEYNVSGSILSIIIKSSQKYNDAEYYDVKYKSYNINLKTMKVLTDEEIFKKFNIKEEKVEYFIAYKFLNYYNDLVDKKYFTEKECDFNCFLESKNVVDYMSDNNYYIRDNHLEVYKAFNIYSEYKEEDYFLKENKEFARFIIK